MSKTNVRYKLHVVSHTHWDREWYSPFQQYRQRLVRLVDRLLDLMERNAEYRYFVLDGQSIVLEDYFAIRPENRERFKALVQAGRLETGPWYVLPDEFLVSAEALIRNLQIGHRVANEHGGVMKVGYMPDSFGHIAQMPQLLRGCNIDNFVFSRGLGDEEDQLGTEFLWIAPDGNRVLAIFQYNGYCNGVDLGFEGFGEHLGETPRLDVMIDRLQQEINKIGQVAKPASDGAKHILINNGCDHIEPQPELPKMLSYANSVLKDCTAEHTTFSKFIATLRRSGLSFPNHSGELHGSKRQYVLSGVFSARVYLKQQNDACETLLAHIAEPLATLAWIRGGANHGSGFLTHAWKVLLHNHPHDSICGCSIDLVHQEMLGRFSEARQVGENVVEAALDTLAQRVRRALPATEGPSFIVANPLAASRREVMRTLVVLPSGRMSKTLAVVDNNNQPLPTHIIRSWPIASREDYNLPEAFSKLGQTMGQHPLTFENKRAQLLQDRALYHLDASKTDKPWQVAELEFLTPEMAPVGYRAFAVRSVEPDKTKAAAETPSAAPVGVRVKGSLVENDFLKVKFYPDGSFDLLDKTSARQYQRCHIFEDTEDVGDEYDYSPAAKSQTAWSRGKKGKLRVVHQSPLSAEIEVTTNLSLPAEFDRGASTKGRRSRKFISGLLEIRFTITATSPYVAVRTTFNNLVRDHRLRVHFPTPMATNHSLAGQQFYVIERSLKKPHGKNWLQPPSPTDPMQHFCALEERKSGLAILTQGLYEYEARREGKGTSLILTLMRAVGWLSRKDLATRPNHAGPAFPTPEAQCQGQHVFHYAVMPYAGNWEKANLPMWAQRYRVPLLEKVCRGASSTGSALPAEFSLLRVEPDSLIITAVKKCDNRDTVLVRLYNASSQRVRGKLHWGLSVSHAWKVNLLEERLEEVTVFSNSRVDLDCPSWRITTVELEMSKSSLGA